MNANVPALRYPRPTAQVEPFVEVLGYDLAISFLLHFGGAQLNIGKCPQERSALVAVIGLDKAKALGAISHRLPTRIPLAKRWIAACLLSRGASVAEIAERLECRTCRFAAGRKVVEYDEECHFDQTPARLHTESPRGKRMRRHSDPTRMKSAIPRRSHMFGLFLPSSRSNHLKPTSQTM